MIDDSFESNEHKFNSEMPIDRLLRERAQKVIPGGMYGHQTIKNLTIDYPQFLSSGKGGRVFDVDGNSYIDLMCSYGPIILGHKYPAVEEAVLSQSLLGDCLNTPGPKLVDLCELLVKSIDHADWAILAKNGTDATTACITIARAKTKKSIILAAKGSYHGAAPWCTPSMAGVLASDRTAIDYFEYNNLESFMAAANRAGNDLAGVIITPFKHIEGLDQELVNPLFAEKIREVCTLKNAALILDDVRCGFRLSFGGSWEPLGIKPDLSAWSKAIANGYPLAAIVGSDEWRQAASEIFVTGSFWYNSIPISAGIATINAIKSQNVVSKLEIAGGVLQQGITEQAKSHNLDIQYTGHVAMPYLRFRSDKIEENYHRMEFFSSQLIKYGVYIAPRHNWFLNLSHSDDSLIPLVLEATNVAFKDVRSKFGGD